MTALLLIGALVGKVTDFLKALVNKDWNAVITMLVVWVAGVLVTLLFAASDLALTVPGIDVDIHAANTATLVIIGVMASSLFSVVYDFKKAIDQTDSAATPPLLGKSTGGA